MSQYGNPSSKVSANRDPMILTFVDQTHDAEVAARDAAETRWREKLNEGGRFRRFLRGIWMGENGIAGRFYFEKYKREALDHIQQQGDVNALYGDEASLRTAAQAATISRFQSEYDEMIHDAAGERRQELAADSAFGQAMKQLIRRYASGEITSAEALKEERGRVLDELKENGADADIIGEGKVRIDNLTQIAEAVKGAVEHGESIDRVMEGMKIYTGESRAGVRTEAHLGKIDRAIEKLQKSKIGSLAGPETVSLAAAVALGVAHAGKGTLLRAFGVTGIPGLIGGVFAGMRENKRVKEERALHARELAQGAISLNKGRRASMEKTRYETVTASHLVETLGEIPVGEDASPEDLQQMYQALADIETRIRLSDERNIDLVSFSGATDVAIERFELDLARAQAKVELGRRLGDLPEEFRRDLGIENTDTVDQALGRSTDALLSINSDIDAKDQAFAKLKRKRVAAAATGFATSFLIGVAAQEGLAFASSSYDGLLEHHLHGKNPSADGTQTLLEGIFHGQSASTQTNIIETSSTYLSHDIGGHSSLLDLPDNYELVKNQDGTVNIVSPDGTIFASDITFEPDGSLSDGAIDELRAKGALVADLSHTITETETTVVELTVSEYIEKHSSETTQVTRDFWYDNDTSLFDRNELRLHWAGDNGHSPDGSINLSTAAMSSDGSFHGANSTSWAEQAQNGTLKFAVSASVDSQNQVFMIDVAPDGSINIPADHPAAKLFSINADGQTEFHGGYGEVVEIHSNEDGVTHMAPLATIVGDNSISTISTEVETAIEKTVPKFSVTPPNIEQIIDIPGREVEGFGGPVVVPRRPLENIARRLRGGYYYRGGYGERLRASEYASQVEDFSPTLRSNPEAQLNLADEMDWYRSRLAERDGQAYVNEIDQLVNSSEELTNMPETTKMIVTIPVAAASEQDNIYETLRLYNHQDDEAKSRTVILLSVNWLDDAPNDPEKAENIRKTLAEIERARRDFPSLRIAAFEKTYDRQQVEQTGGVIGYVARDLMNVALFAIKKRIDGGLWDENNDVIIMRNDADMKGFSRHGWREMLKAADGNPETDIFKGVTRFGVGRSSSYPGFGVIADAATTINTLSAARGEVHTGGANFAVQASTLAAVGGLGALVRTGAGSDDVEVGRRIQAARMGAIKALASGRGYYYSRSGSGQGTNGRSILKQVGGANVDVDAERFIRKYMEGRWWQEVWGDGRSTSSFSSGPGGYAPRDSGQLSNKPEKIDDAAIERIELNLMSELLFSPEQDRRRVLSLIFRDTPGAYTLTEGANGELVGFTLTRAGRKAIRRYIKEDSAGRRWSFGERKRAQLYGYELGGRVRSGAMVARS